MAVQVKLLDQALRLIQHFLHCACTVEVGNDEIAASPHGGDQTRQAESVRQLLTRRRGSAESVPG